MDDNKKPTFKKCTMCKMEKLLKHFSNEKNNLTDGKRGKCKVCDKASRKPYLEKTHELRKEKARRKYENMTKEQRSEYIKKKSLQNQHRFKTSPEARRKKMEYDRSDRGLYASYRSDAKRRSRSYEFKLEFEVFSKLINSSCHYCGLENCRGVDRVNNENGYIEDNCVPCCRRCNEMKMDYTLEQWFGHMEKILKNTKKAEACL